MIGAIVWQAGAAGKKKKKKTKDAADMKYGGLESSRPDRRVSSTRYTSAPRKDNPKSIYAPMAPATGSNARTSAGYDKAKKKKEEDDKDELEAPIATDDDYLLPQSGTTAANYVDMVADSANSMCSLVV